MLSRNALSGEAWYFQQIPCQGICSIIGCPHETKPRKVGSAVFRVCPDAQTVDGAVGGSDGFGAAPEAESGAQVVEPSGWLEAENEMVEYDAGYYL